jgi:hypothetical protein
MKRTIVVLTFVFVLAISSFAATDSESAPSLSKKQLNALITSAKTPSDHERIAAYYRVQAGRYLAESNAHAKMASEFASNPAVNNSKHATGTVEHCKYLAESLKAKSVKAEALAQEHAQMAKDAAQK